MKQLRIALLNASLLSILALCCCCVYGQIRPVARTTAKPLATATASTPAATAPTKSITPVNRPVIEMHPLVRTMDEYRKTAAYAKRKAAYDKSTPSAVSTTYPYRDKSTLKITLDKRLPVGQEPGPPVAKQNGKAKTEKPNGYTCTVTPIALTANSNTFLNNDYSGSMANIVPGLCYTYANLTNGSWGNQTGDRHTQQLSCDEPNMSGSSDLYVVNPNQGSLQDGVNRLFRGLPNTTGNESFFYQVSLTENTAAYSLSIGAAASGFGANISNNYGTANQNRHVHMTIDATKTMFSITTTPPDSGFFINPGIESTPYLTFISEVQYGVRVLANADITFSSEEEADQFKASYSGFGFSASLDVNYGSVSSSVQTTINSYIIGGPGGVSVAYSLKELKNQIDKIFKNCTYPQARPIKYKASTMSGETLNTTSITDDFNVRTCVPADGGSPGIDNVMVTVSQGSDGKEPGTGFIMVLDAGTTSASSWDPEASMFVAFNEPMNESYDPHSDHTIVFRPGKRYTGKLDMAALQKSGGHLHIWPISYRPGSTGGIGYDVWDITQLYITINLKPSPANPNPSPIGGPKGGQLMWTLGNQNQLVLNSAQGNSYDLYFDGNMIAQGHN